MMVYFVFFDSLVRFAKRVGAITSCCVSGDVSEW